MSSILNFEYYFLLNFCFQNRVFFKKIIYFFFVKWSLLLILKIKIKQKTLNYFRFKFNGFEKFKRKIKARCVLEVREVWEVRFPRQN